LKVRKIAVNRKQVAATATCTFPGDREILEEAYEQQPYCLTDILVLVILSY